MSFRQFNTSGITVALLILSGCATTRFSDEMPCQSAVAAGSRVLVPWLPDRHPEFYLDGLREIFSPQNIEITSSAEQEWQLRAAGIYDAVDPASRVALQRAGYSHLLLIRELSNRSESPWLYATRQEVSLDNVPYAYKPLWQEQGNRSKLQLELVPLNDPTATHSLVAETVISHLTIRHDDGGETYVNPTTVESARYKALRKASRRILKRCSTE